MVTKPWSIVTITICKDRNSEAAVSAETAGEKQLQLQDIVRTHLGASKLVLQLTLQPIA